MREKDLDEGFEGRGWRYPPLRSALLAALRGSPCGVAGRGVYWVTPADRFGRL